MVGIAVCAAACAIAPHSPAATNNMAVNTVPIVQLAPSDLGREVSVQQQLSIERYLPAQSDNTMVNRNSHFLQAVLNVNNHELNLVALAYGVRVMTFMWDGQRYTEERHPMLPKEVDAQHIVRDIQLTYWPLLALVKHFPAEWHLMEQDNKRVLSKNGITMVVIQYSNMQDKFNGTADLENMAERYHLHIASTLEATTSE